MLKLLFVTDCCTKTAPPFEQLQKELFLDTDMPRKSRSILNFLHKGTAPHQVVEKAKDKRPMLVFDQTCTTDFIAKTVKAVRKKLNGSSPSFFLVSSEAGNEKVEGVTVVKNYIVLKAQLN